MQSSSQFQLLDSALECLCKVFIHVPTLALMQI
jgi:hypothetical protein